MLVTGANGFLGSKTVAVLVQKGYRVRALVRTTSRADRLQEVDVEICHGDITDRQSLEPAFVGVDYVVHAAADTKGVGSESIRITVNGARNILSLSSENRIARLVYISSCSVYGVADVRNRWTIDEDGPLERYPEKRGVYSEAKLEAERLVLDFTKETGLSYVCLRPGTILGEGGEVFTPMMGFSFGNKLFAIIGDGSFVMPFVYVDDLVEAIVAALETVDGVNRTYNVVDPTGITKKEYVDSVLRRLHPKATFMYVPYGVLYFAVWLQEMLLAGILRREPLMTRYRLVSSQRSVLYDSSRARNLLGWNPPMLKETIDRFVMSEMNRQMDSAPRL